MTMTGTLARARYATNSVATASPAKLLTMLYDRLVLDLDRAEQAQFAGDRQTANDQLLHAQAIVTELECTLRTDAWEGAPQLAALYDFLYRELVRANTAADPTVTAACRALVEPLRDAWHEAARALAADAGA